MSQTAIKIIAFIAPALIICLGNTELIESADKKPPFYPGEKLTLQIKWGAIPEGEATLEVLPMQTINGIKSYHFLMTARTNPFVDLFYKVR